MPKSLSTPPGLWEAVRIIPPSAFNFLMQHDTAGVDIMPFCATYSFETFEKVLDFVGVQSVLSILHIFIKK